MPPYRRLPNGQVIDLRPTPAPAAAGTTFAKEAQPASGLTLPGGATSTASAALAAAPKAGLPASIAPPGYDPTKPLAQFATQPRAAAALPASIAPPSIMPQVLGGTAADSATAVRQAALGTQPVAQTTQTVQPGTSLDIGGGQVLGAGSKVTPVAPQYGHAPGVTNFSGAAPSQFGGTGIIGQDGSEISATSLYGANGRPTAPTGPVSYADQKAAILKAYPKVGQAGTPENKLFVDAFKAGGSDTGSVLNLAHTLFAPKTQAAQVAQDTGGVTSKTLTADQTAVTQANMTPEQKAAQAAALTVKGQANQAKVDAVGQQVMDANSTPGAIRDRIAAGVQDVSHSVGGAISGAGSGVKRFFSDPTTGQNGPVDPTALPRSIAPPATNPAATGAYSSSAPAAPAATPVATPGANPSASPAPVISSSGSTAQPPPTPSLPASIAPPAPRSSPPPAPAALPTPAPAPNPVAAANGGAKPASPPVPPADPAAPAIGGATPEDEEELKRRSDEAYAASKQVAGS